MCFPQHRSAALAALVLAAVSAAAAEVAAEPLPPGAVARMGTLRLRTAGQILAFSPDEKMFAVASPEPIGSDVNIVHLWSVSTGLPMRRFGGPAVPISAGVFSSDGQTFQAAASGQLIRWNVADGKRLRETKVPRLYCLDFCRSVLSPDGKRWASRYPGPRMDVGETATGTILAALESPLGRWWGPITLSGDGKRAAGFAMPPPEREGYKPAKREKGRWVVLDVATGKTVGDFPLEKRQQDSCPGVLSPDGRLLAIRCGDQSQRRFQLWLWEPDTGRTLLEISDTEMSVYSVQFTPDGRSLLIGTAREVRVWDVARKRFGRSLPVPETDYLICSPGGKYVATQQASGPLHLPYFARLWDLASGAEVHPAPLNHTTHVTAAAFAPDGRTLVSISAGPIRFGLFEAQEGEALIWDARTGRPLRRCVLAPGVPQKVLFAPDGKLLVSVYHNHTPGVLEIDPITGTVVASRPGRDILALSADSERLLCKEGDRDEPILIVQEQRGGRKISRIRPTGTLSYAGFLPGGDRLLLVCSVPPNPKKGSWTTEVEIYEMATENQVGGWAVERTPTRLRASPDGWLLAAFADDRKLELLDPETGHTVRSLRAEHTLHSGLFSPDGAFLALDEGNHIGLWEVATGEQVTTFEDRAAYARAFGPLAFSPHGRRLASASGNADMLLWDVFDVRENPECLTDDNLRCCWQNLASSSGAAGYQAMRTLLGRPAQAADFLSRRLPVPPIEAAILRRWLTDLGSDSFRVREEATKRLTEAADIVEPELRKALAAGPDLETARRIRAVLATIGTNGLVHASGERLRLLRGIQVLERLGTPAAKDGLQKLASGAPAAWRTRAAAAALARLRSLK
jgi:WD40 repeat protein